VAAETVRATVYIEARLHQALRLKAAATHRSISELVNDAVRAALEAPSNGAVDQAIDYDALVARIRAELSPQGSCKVSAEDLLEQWRHLPPVDPVRFRADIDSVIDSSL
jgi:hypothetical protein